MAQLALNMPPLAIDPDELRRWGQLWLATEYQEQIRPRNKAEKALGVRMADKTKKSDRFTRKQSVNFASFIDASFAKSLAAMLGDIPVLAPDSRNPLLPRSPDCVEIGAVRIIGGVRPQNFDVAYRPDGPRVAFDSKTLNDAKSVGKNWQNMVNDLATEATTVHTRYPFAVVTFIVVLPRPALARQQELDIIRTLERLSTRQSPVDQVQLAEAISLVVWDPATATVDPNTPEPASRLRVEKLSETLYPHYVERYKGLPPHNVAEVPDDEEDGDSKGTED